MMGSVFDALNWIPQVAQPAAGTNSLTVLVPSGYGQPQTWQVLWASFSLVTSAVAGNRQMVLDILDPAGVVVASIEVNGTQAASLTNDYMLAPGLPDLNAARTTGDWLTPIPSTFLLGPGFQIRVSDASNIDGAGDALTLKLGYLTRKQ